MCRTVACLGGMHRPHPHLLETGAIWGGAPARLTVRSSHLFYWPKPFHWVPLTFGASVEGPHSLATCLYFHVWAVFSFPNAGTAPFRPRRMCPRLPMGPHMIPRMHKRFNRLLALPSVRLMSWHCLTTPLPRCLPWVGQAPFLAWRYSSRCLVGSVVSSPGFVVLRSWR